MVENNEFTFDDYLLAASSQISRSYHMTINIRTTKNEHYRLKVMADLFKSVGICLHAINFFVTLCSGIFCIQNLIMNFFYKTKKAYFINFLILGDWVEFLCSCNQLFRKSLKVGKFKEILKL